MILSELEIIATFSSVGDNPKAKAAASEFFIDFFSPTTPRNFETFKQSFIRWYKKNDNLRYETIYHNEALIKALTVMERNQSRVWAYRFIYLLMVLVAIKILNLSNYTSEGLVCQYKQAIKKDNLEVMEDVHLAFSGRASMSDVRFYPTCDVVSFENELVTIANQLVATKFDVHYVKLHFMDGGWIISITLFKMTVTSNIKIIEGVFIPRPHFLIPCDAEYKSHFLFPFLYEMTRPFAPTSSTFVSAKRLLCNLKYEFDIECIREMDNTGSKEQQFLLLNVRGHPGTFLSTLDEFRKMRNIDAEKKHANVIVQMFDEVDATLKTSKTLLDLLSKRYNA